MKAILKYLLATSILFSFTSCEKDEGELPEIKFKSGADYTSSDVSVPAGTSITIGVEAEKNEEEKEDVLKKFDISESINGESANSIYNINIPEASEDHYEYDYSVTMGDTSGETHEYTFTITNRDGLVNQVDLTVTIE